MRLLGSLGKPQYFLHPVRALGRLGKEFHDTGPLVDVDLPWGVTIRVNTRESIGRSIWKSGVYDLAVAETISRLLDPGDTAVDAGANIGYLTGLMASRVGASGRVLAFEPHPDIYKVLQQNIAACRRRADFGEIVAYEMALSDAVGSATLTCPDGFDGNQGTARLAPDTTSITTAFTVAIRPLDTFVGTDRIALLKLDVEGHEHAALKGASESLGAHLVRHIVYEDFDGPGSDAHRLLSSFGYTVLGVGRRPHKPVLTRAHERLAVDTTYETPNYLATLDPGDARRRLGKWGWSVL